MWHPEIDTIQGPRYLAIAEALAKDLAAGRVRAGDRLPTHRDLAASLSVTVGTVSRAYADARRRGLVYGHVGRGTFVGPQRVLAGLSDDAPKTLDLSVNCPHTHTTGAHLRRAFDQVLRDPRAAEYRPQTGSASHKEAAAAWLGSAGIDTDPSRIVITAGAQHALCVALAQLVQPGDTVITERFTYAGALALAKLLKIQLVGVESDGEGVCPDALANAIARHRPRAAYLMPTLQNPTASTMPDARRDAVADILERADVTLVEDGIYRFLDPDGPAPITSRMKVGGGFFATSVSKSLAGGLRVGYLACPGPASLAAEAIEASTLMAPGVAAAAVDVLMRDGTLGSVEAERRSEVVERQRMARPILGHLCDRDASDRAQWLWLRLPAGWDPSSFASVAEARAQVKVACNGVFQAPQGTSDRTAFARVSLVHHPDIEVVRGALVRLRDLLSTGPDDPVAGC